MPSRYQRMSKKIRQYRRDPDAFDSNERQALDKEIAKRRGQPTRRRGRSASLSPNSAEMERLLADMDNETKEAMFMNTSSPVHSNSAFSKKIQQYLRDPEAYDTNERRAMDKEIAKRRGKQLSRSPSPSPTSAEKQAMLADMEQYSRLGGKKRKHRKTQRK